MRKTNFLVLLCALVFSWQLSAQTLSEGFEGATFPPTGWDTITNGIGSGFNWTTDPTSATGSNAAFVRYENVTGGQAEDWLVTPLTPITAADSLVFSHRQQFTSNWGSIYTIRVGTTTQRDTANFTTIRTYTEADFGPTNYENDTIDLSAYAGMSVYIAFVMSNDDGDSWYVDDVQVGFPNCFVPSALTASNLTTASADLDWTENGSATMWQVEWGPTGFTQGMGTFVIDTSAANPVTLTTLSAQTDYQWYVRAICGPGDTSAWSVVNNFTTPCAAFPAPFSEGFTSFPPTCWDEADGGTVATGPTTTGTGSWGPGGSGARVNLYTTSSNEWILSPIIDFGAGGYELALDVLAYDFGASAGTFSGMGSDDTVQVVISTDGGATWTAVYTWDAANPPPSTSTTERIDLTAYTGGNNMIAIFSSEGTTSASEDYYFEVDNFELRIPPMCPAPIANAATNLTATSATLNWTAGGTETQWEVEWDTAGFTQGSGTLAIVNTVDTLNLTSLMANTSYDWYVRAICGAGDSSAFVAGSTFRTSFQAPMGVSCTSGNPGIVFTEEFDNNNAGWTGDIGSGGGDWEIPDASGSGNTGADNAHSGANYMNYEATSGNAGGAAVSPAIDLTAGADGAELSFWLHAYGSDMGDLTVGVGTSATGPFTPEFVSVGQVQMSGADPWQNIGVDLTAYLGQVIYIEFDMSNVTGYRSDMSIDLMEVTTCLSCAAPSNESTFNVMPTSADVAWMENGTATNWFIEWDTAGAPFYNSSMVASNDTATIMGLTPSTSYEWRVRAVCAAGDTSSALGPFTFMTPATCLATTASTVSNVTDVSADLGWTENGTATQWEIEWDTAGFALGTGRNKFTTTTNPHALTGLTPQTDYDWYVRAICTVGDSSFWSTVSSFTTACPVFTTYPYTENFDNLTPNNGSIFSCIGTDNLTGCWTNDAANTNNWTARSSATGSSNTGPPSDNTTGSTNYVFLESSSCNNTLSAMNSPIFDMTSLTNPRISFWYHMQGATMGTLELLATTDGGVTYDTIFSLSGDQGTAWINQVISLSAYAGNASVEFRFEGTTGTSYTSDMAIDDIQVEETPQCLMPTANAATNVASDSADVSWVENGTATQWEVQYGSAGFMAGSGTSIIVMTDTFTTISGLSSATAYDWYVRAICGPGDTSMWTAVSSFATSCPAPSVAATLPFIEGWETASGTVFDDANLVCNASYSWDLETSLPEGRARYGADADDRASGIGAITLDRSPNGLVNINYLILTLEMSAYTTNTDLELLFDYRHHGEEPHANDSLWVRGSDSDPWVGIYDLYANRQTTFITVGPLDIDAALTAAGQTVSSSFQVRFGQEDNFPTGSDGFSFDNIVIRQTPSCFAPIGLASNVITTTSADLSWNDTNSVTAPEYQYSVGPANFAAGTGIQMVVTTDSVTAPGLMSSTNYDWYVRAICGPGDTSLWSSVASFQTLCTPFVAPLTESFDGTTMPACWSQSAVQDGPWVFGTPGGFTWNTQGCAGVPTDVTGNGGNYAALDFSGTGVVDVVLEMNDVDVSGLTSPYLDFYFYMCGLTYTPINILYVEAFDGTNWNLVDSIQEHTNGWKRYGFDISGFTYSTNLVKIRFRASSAGNTVTMFRGDQAIDDVTIGNAPAVELRALEVVRPLSGCGLSATDSVEFTFVNEGSAAQTGFDVVYSVNGVAITPETFTGTIQPGDTAGFTFQTSVDLSTAGVYSITAYTSAMNDFNTTNDSAFTSVVSTASSSVFPYVESFESGNGGWLVAGNANWELGAPAGVFINSASDGTQAWMTDLDANYPDNALGYVISPCFDFSNVDYPYITMDIWYDIESQWDGSILEASTDGGLTWTIIGEEDDDINWYNDSANVMVANNISADGRAWTGNGSVSGVPGTNGWINAQHELYDLAGEPTVQLRMTFASDGNTNDDGMAFDNVRIIDSVGYAPIGDINQNTPTGTPESDGVITFTSGIVMGTDLDGNAGYLFTVIDMSSGAQEGIGVFSPVDVSGYVVNQGDSVMIRGEVGQFRGLTQLTNIDSIMVIASNVTTPAPIEVDFPSEGTESKWIKINNVHSLEVSGTAGNNNNHDFTRGSDTLTMRVDRDTDVDDSLGVYPIAIGDSLCSITGIGGQFSFAPNLDDGYQIVMQRYSDMDTSACSFVVGIDPVTEEEAIFSISPNPSNGEFVIKTAGFESPTVRITIRDISGRIASEELVNNANNAFQKSIDISNNAKGVYFISIQDGDTVINQKLILQ